MTDDELDREMQRAAEEHLDACWEAHEDNAPSPASAPFCGCQTCEVRETLWAGFNVLRDRGLLDA